MASRFIDDAKGVLVCAQPATVNTRMAAKADFRRNTTGLQTNLFRGKSPVENSIACNWGKNVEDLFLMREKLTFWANLQVVALQNLVYRLTAVQDHTPFHRVIFEPPALIIRKAAAVVGADIGIDPPIAKLPGRFLGFLK